MAYAVLSPYLVPEEMQRKKKVNIGDGFILRRVMSLLEPHECAYTYSTREPLTEEKLEKINTTKALVIAGTNQLSDTFEIASGFDNSNLSKIKVPIVPFAIGVTGHKRLNRIMSDPAKALLREIHGRIRHSSWRCHLTVEYLAHNLPELEDRFLMTGCPVIYDKDLLGGTSFSSRSNRVVITVTERDDFWERETRTIDFVAERFGSAERVLSLHQVFEPSLKARMLERFFHAPFGRSRGRTASGLREFALKRGFKIYVPTSVEECWEFYRICDLHIGSRLHAHLFFLSQAKKSFLTYVDDRMKGFSAAFQFPVCDHNKLDDYSNFDFELVRAQTRKHFETIKKFISYLKEEIL